MWENIKARAANVLELATSKKALITIAAAVLIVLVVKTTPAVVGIAAVAVAYNLAQGFVDGKKVE